MPNISNRLNYKVSAGILHRPTPSFARNGRENFIKKTSREFFPPKCPLLGLDRPLARDMITQGGVRPPFLTTGAWTVIDRVGTGSPALERSRALCVKNWNFGLRWRTGQNILLKYKNYMYLLGFRQIGTNTDINTDFFLVAPLQPGALPCFSVLS